MSDKHQGVRPCASNMIADQQYLMRWFKVLLVATAATAAAICYIAASPGGIMQ